MLTANHILYYLFTFYTSYTFYTFHTLYFLYFRYLLYLFILFIYYILLILFILLFMYKYTCSSSQKTTCSINKIYLNPIKYKSYTQTIPVCQTRLKTYLLYPCLQVTLNVRHTLCLIPY